MATTKALYLKVIRVLSGLAILLITAGVFHHELLEFAHVLSHQISGDYSPHTHHHHHSEHHHSHHKLTHDENVADHDHTFLEVAERNLFVSHKTPLAQDSPSKISSDRDTVQFSLRSFSASAFHAEQRKMPIYSGFLYTKPFIEVTTPPPRRRL
ncbi:MAG: hypothetical protein WBG42_13185 [Cryomorphaceae bacterium]